MKSTDEIMEKVQEFASSWSLVGGRFDSGDMLEQAEELKANLRESIERNYKLQYNARCSLQADLNNANEKITEIESKCEINRLNAHNFEITLNANLLASKCLEVHCDRLQSELTKSDAGYRMALDQCVESANKRVRLQSECDRLQESLSSLIAICKEEGVTSYIRQCIDDFEGQAK
jgi:chromosome segregation ATPase